MIQTVKTIQQPATVLGTFADEECNQLINTVKTD
jgi:hypothetical protein